MACAAAAEAPPRLRVAVVNYSGLPVHATAVALDEAEVCAKLGAAAGTPVRAGLADGKAVPLSRGIEDGRAVIRAYVGMGPRSRVEFAIERAERWNEDSLVSATGTVRAVGATGREPPRTTLSLLPAPDLPRRSTARPSA